MRCFGKASILAGMIDMTGSGPSDTLEQRLSKAAERVRAAIGDVITEIPIRAHRPSELQRVLKLDRTLASRLLQAVRLPDPLAALHRLPGPYGIRLLLKAATGTVGNPEVVGRAEKALVELEHLVLTHVGHWNDLDAALSGWLPDVREELDAASRRAAFKAMSNIRGIMAETELSITLLHPSTTRPGWVDRACIAGLCGMRRLRPGAPMGLLHGHSIAPPPGSQRLSLDGQPIDQEHGPGLLREFSTTPTPRFDVVVAGNTVHYLLEQDDVGLDSRVDLLFGDVTRGRYPANQGVSPQPAAPGAGIDVPVRTLIVDVLLHEEVWPGVEPELQLYDTAVRGIANPVDPARKMDRRDVLDSVQGLGAQAARLRTPEVARYAEMIAFVCEKLGWNAADLRGFRYRAEHPVYGYQVAMIFQPPAESPSPR